MPELDVAGELERGFQAGLGPGAASFDPLVIWRRGQRTQRVLPDGWALPASCR